MADEEEECCPLCMEELDLTDTSFNACPCGYQVCLWCWHQIKNEYNALCPACRAPYSELSKQKSPLDREDVLRRTKQRKQKEKSERRTASQSKIPTTNRRNLANVRVMQRNLVYAIGLPQHFAEDDILRSHECFGQYGKIVKAVVNKSHLNTDRMNATASAYITFANKDDALSCIIAIDGYYLDGCLLRASFGTTKYCNFFLRNLSCNNHDCLYLHELGEQDDSFTKEEMQSALHSGKAAFRDLTANEVREGTRFPPPLKALVDSQRANPGASAAVVASSAAKAAHASADRQAQSAAAVHKLRQNNGGGTTTTTTTNPSRVMRRGDSYSRIVTGMARSSASPSSPSPSSSSSSSSSPATPPPPFATEEDHHHHHHQQSMAARSVDDRKPNLRVDTSVADRAAAAAASASADSVVGPLEALKLATGSSSQEPAWAQPFPSSSMQLHNESDDTLLDSRAQEPVFSPFGVGFNGGLRASSTTSSSPPSDNNSVNDPWGGTTSKMSPLPVHRVEETLTSPFGRPLNLHSGANGHNLRNGGGGGSSGLSGLSFASIDAIFSDRNESSEALAGLLGVQLPVAPQPQPLVHSSPSVATSANARSSRFAFANQPSYPSDQPASRGPPPMGSGGGGGLPPASPYRGLGGYSSSFRTAPLPPPPPPPMPSSFQSPMDASGFPSLGSRAPPLPPGPPSSMRSFARSQSEPYPPSSSSSSVFGGLGGESSGGGGGGSNGLAFLQQMLPNVNISFGGEYATSNGMPMDRNSGSSGWGSLGALGFDSNAPMTNAREADDGGYYDPALMASSAGLSSFYGLEDDRHLTAPSAFGGSFRQARSVMDK